MFGDDKNIKKIEMNPFFFFKKISIETHESIRFQSVFTYLNSYFITIKILCIEGCRAGKNKNHVSYRCFNGVLVRLMLKYIICHLLF